MVLGKEGKEKKGEEEEKIRYFSMSPSRFSFLTPSINGSKGNGSKKRKGEFSL